MSNYDLGVEYRPKGVSNAPTFTLNQLKDRGIKYIRVQWVDLTNKTRLRVVSIDYFEKVLQSGRPGLGAAKAALGLVDLAMAEGFDATGEYLCVPDMTSLRVCPYAPGHASVMVWLQDKTPSPGPDGSLTVDVDLCPRTSLSRVIQEAQTMFGLDFLIGFEIEFILLKSTRPVEPVNYHAWSAADGFPSGQVETIVLEEIADAIRESDLELQMYHAEAAPGQYEVIMGPLSAKEAADALVHTRELIRNIASKHGLRATFAPRPFMSSAGTGAHTHISLHSNSEPKPRDDLASYEKSFLAGVLEHLQALPALTLPIPPSFKRVADHNWAGGTYVCWGTENREAPVRLVNESSPSSRRFEMRFVDATACPYLVLAGILTAGLDGLHKRQELTVKNCAAQVPADMTVEERKAFGITRRLPLTYKESRTYFAQDELFKRTFGENFVMKYLSVNKLLGEILDRGCSEEEKLSHLVEFF